MILGVTLPTNVGGLGVGLSVGFKEFGISLHTVSYEGDYLKYNSDLFVWKNGDSRIVKELKRLLFLKYIFRYDFVIFNFGGGLFKPTISFGSPVSIGFYGKFIVFLYRLFMCFIEIFLLKILGRKIIIIYQGDDARRKRYCVKNFEITFAQFVDNNYYDTFSDFAKWLSVWIYNFGCHKIYSVNPDLLHVLPKRARFLPYCNVVISNVRPSFPRKHNNVLRVGHAPTNRLVKGTQFFLNAVAILQRQGYSIEIVLIENVSNVEALRLLRSVDVVFDQLFVGWYGGVAVEAMSLGKPVVCYLRESDFKFLPEQLVADLPVINANSDSIATKLQWLADMPKEELTKMGVASRKFAQKWHSPNVVVNSILQDSEIDLARL